MTASFARLAAAALIVLSPTVVFAIVPVGIDSPTSTLPPGGVYDSTSTTTYPGAPTDSVTHISATEFPVNSFFDVFVDIDVNISGHVEHKEIELPHNIPIADVDGDELPDLIIPDISGSDFDLEFATETDPNTTVTPEGGGMFRITSFFDVFTELSVDGGNTFLPQSGTTHLQLDTILPEPTSLGFLASFAVLCLRRNRRNEVGCK